MCMAVRECHQGVHYVQLLTPPTILDLIMTPVNQRHRACKEVVRSRGFWAPILHFIGEQKRRGDLKVKGTGGTSERKDEEDKKEEREGKQG